MVAGFYSPRANTWVKAIPPGGSLKKDPDGGAAAASLRGQLNAAAPSLTFSKDKYKQNLD